MKANKSIDSITSSLKRNRSQEDDAYFVPSKILKSEAVPFTSRTGSILPMSQPEIMSHRGRGRMSSTPASDDSMEVESDDDEDGQIGADKGTSGTEVDGEKKAGGFRERSSSVRCVVD
jgi:hypothetical protein